MFRKKNPRQAQKLQDARRSLAPTVGFRDYILSKKPSIKREAKTIIESVADQLMGTFGPDRYEGENTFGIDERLEQADLKTAIAREKIQRAATKGDEDEVEGQFDTSQYYLLGDPYLVLLLYRSIARFSTEVVDRLREEKVASRVALALRPVAADKKFDPYAALAVSPNASQETINRRIRKLQHFYKTQVNQRPEDKKLARVFQQITDAKAAIGTKKARYLWDSEKPLSTPSTFFDPNIIARWQSIGDVMSVAYAAQKAAFEMIDRGDDYMKLIEELKSSSKLTAPQRKASPKRYSSLAYEENPKKKVSPEQKNRSVLKTERLWERYCRSEKFDDLLKAYEALLEAKGQVTQYKHKQQISQGLKQARAELKRHAK